tara:strand:+ start:119 stop:289 length:171 start_codon:yes stop_codon:yes gene_type:complete
MATTINYTAPKIISAEEDRVMIAKNRIHAKCARLEKKCSSIAKLIKKTSRYLDTID